MFLKTLILLVKLIEYWMGTYYFSFLVIIKFNLKNKEITMLFKKNLFLINMYSVNIFVGIIRSMELAKFKAKLKFFKLKKK